VSGGTVAVAGATGVLGRLVTAELRLRGVPVRALTRQAGKTAEDLGADEVAIWNTADSNADPSRALDGAEVVFSCLGASVLPARTSERRSYFDVDYALNKSLLGTAKARGVRRFVYVSVFGAPGYKRTAYVRAHEAVVEEIRKSGLSWGVVRPTGFFSALAAYLDMAKKGGVPLFGDGSARTNPFDERDLAVVCADVTLSDQPEQEVPIGGPETLTRRHIAELAFDAVGQPPRFSMFPVAMVKPLPFLMRPFDARLSELIAFAAAVSVSECIAPPYGTRCLYDYFVERIAAERGESCGT
jgi:uncharacterized protein YbjT (DUF2867 family)